MLTPRRGFTLIEMLVILAIIAMLAAFLYPVYAQAREQAYATTCMENGRNLALAARMYAQDHDDTYPIALLNGNTDPHNEWAREVEPYIQRGSNRLLGIRLLFCPKVRPSEFSVVYALDAAANQRWADPWYAELDYFVGLHVTWAYNYCIFSPLVRPCQGQPGLDNVPLPAREAEIEQPSATIWFVDSRWLREPRLGYYLVEPPSPRALPRGTCGYWFDGQLFQCVGYRHGQNQKTTCLWADGHVSMVSFAQISQYWWWCRDKSC